MPKTNAQRVFRNFGVVLRGRGIAGVFNMLALALMAHVLSPVQFGLVVLLHTYVLAIRGFLNFRTFEAVVKYGVPLHAIGDNDGLRRLLRVTTSVDVLSSIVATLVGIGAASITGKFLHWDAQMVTIAMLYSLVMLSSAIGTPNGALRLYDRFDLLGTWYTISPAVRFSGVVIAWFFDADMLVFVGIFGRSLLYWKMAGYMCVDTGRFISTCPDRSGVASITGNYLRRVRNSVIFWV